MNSGSSNHPDEETPESRACEILRRTFIWIAEGRSLEQRGLRATVVLYCVRPDLIDGQTLESIGFAAGVTRQRAHRLATEFRQTVGWEYG